MIKLLKGDDAKHLISIDLPEAAFAGGMMIEFEIGGLKIQTEAAASIEVLFPATWTALQPLGRILGTVRLIDGKGMTATITKTFPVLITDDVSEVSGGSVVSGTVKPVVDFSDIETLDETASPGEIKAALNEILKRLKSGISCLVFAAALPAIAADIGPTTVLDDIPGNTTISNLVASSGAAVAGGGGDATKEYIDARDDILYTMATNRPTRTFFEKDVDWEGNGGASSSGGNGAIRTIGTLGHVFRASHLLSTYWYGAQYAETALRAINADNATRAASIGAANSALWSWSFGLKDEYAFDGNPNLCFWDTATGTVLTNAWTRDLPSETKIREIARDALGRTYDEELGVTWVKVARGGAFYEVCETNINTAVIE